MNNKKEVGKHGEEIACHFLENLGYEILERNWFNRDGKMLGEIDIIVKDKLDKIIFVEVKTRKVFSTKIEDEVFPEEQITFQKMSKLQKIAENYIGENNLWNNDWRFDAVSVIVFFDKKLEPKIKHFKNIFF